MGSEPEIPLEREGQYTRLEELGRGGQSVVVRAFDEFVIREVALKQLALPREKGGPEEAPDSPRLFGSGGTSSREKEQREAARKRFLREARLIARLDHPGIVAVHELARRPDGTIFCAQKLVRGETLKKRLGRCTSLTERLQLLPHLLDACQAVAYAHAHQVIHRDLKPANIMVGSFGETVVVDWGLAKASGESEPVEFHRESPDDASVTRTGLTMGTPGYMSPEQARGEGAHVDERSDVFSLGVVLYELLTGRVPFEGATTEHIVERLLTGRFHPVLAVRSDAPPELAAIVERALAFDPAARYPSAGALAKELAAYATGGRVDAYRYRFWELLKKFIAANRALSTVSAAAILVLLGAAAIIVWQLHVARANLAQSFIERARTAEATSDWARAAGYYAASRIERDSDEARWGYALAAERISPRSMSRRGPPESFVDLAPLDDGRLVVLGERGQGLVASDVQTGRELWRAELPPNTQSWALMADQVVIITWNNPNNPGRLSAGRTVLDAATGRLLGSFDPAKGVPCWRSPFPPPVLVTSAGLVIAREGSQGTVLSASVDRDSRCVVSDDGSRVAFDDGAGNVHLWSLTDQREQLVRLVPDVRELRFTGHGLAMVRESTVDVLGGNEEEFSVQIPRGGGTSTRSRPGTVAVSKDGHRLVLDRGGTNHADLVDLRARTVLTSFSYVPGEPRFAFSSDGARVFVAGLLAGSSLTAWQIHSPIPRHIFEGSPRMIFFPSRDGNRILVFHYTPPASRYELYDGEGTRLLSGGLGANANVNLTADGQRIVARDSEGMSVLDTQDGRVLWQNACKDCLRLEPSADGSRILTSSGKRIALYAVGSAEPIWTETDRVGPPGGALRLSPDGTRMVWGQGSTAYVHTLGRPGDFEAKFDDSLWDASFSNGGDRLVIAGRGEIAEWSVGSWRPLWRIPTFASSFVNLDWSADDSVVIASHDSLGTVLLDGATGHHLATVRVSKPQSVYPADGILPSLKAKISRGGGRWELWSFPEPDRGSPRDGLARITSSTGLQLQGIDLVDVPVPAEGAARGR